MSTRDDADYRKALTDAIAMALEQRAKLEHVIAAGIQQQIELYDKSSVPTNRATARLGRDGALERHARQPSEQGRTDVDAASPELVAKLAAADAHDYRKLKEPRQRAEAALAMAETARVSASYLEALAEKAPDVSDAVRTAMALIEKSEAIHAARASASGPRTPGEPTSSDVARDPAKTRGPEARERTATHRGRDVDARAQQPTANGIEVVQRESGDREPRTEKRHSAPENANARHSVPEPTRAPGGNQVTSDEVFTAAKDETRPIVPLEVEDRYLRVGSKFYHPRNTSVVAFEDKGNKLETHSNSERIAETMVTIARARGWDEIKVTGSETFRREVWLEAAAHGMQVKGYTPSEVDKAALAQRSRNIAPNHLEPDGGVRGVTQAVAAVAEPYEARSIKPGEPKGPDEGGPAIRADPPAGKQPATEHLQRIRAFTQKSAAEALTEYPELAGAYAVMASMKKRAAADGLSPRQSMVVMARVQANLVGSIERGELPESKVRERVEVSRQHTVNREIKR